VRSVDLRDERILVETNRFRITGLVSLPRDGYRSRLTDYLNASERTFMALTDVEITAIDSGGGVERCEFLALALSQIVFARPLAAPDG
jgi:hypothetical protein